MIVPSAANMKFKFPEFVTVDNASIEFAIEEAVLMCGNGSESPSKFGTWISEGVQTLAIMYYAAHLLQVSQRLSAAGPTGQVISSERTPDLSVTYAVGDLSKSIDLTDSHYGERFLGLAKRNQPAVLCVNTGVRM